MGYYLSIQLNYFETTARHELQQFHDVFDGSVLLETEIVTFAGHLLRPDTQAYAIGPFDARDDFGAMRKRTDIQPANFLDLQNYVGQFGIEDASLQKIYAILFNKKISKGQRLSNWEADVLSDAQKKYAALDAWACLKIYNQLKQI